MEVYEIGHIFTEACRCRDGRSQVRHRRLLHDDRQGRGQVSPLKFEFNELHGDGELQSVHLSIAVDVSEVPLGGGGGGGGGEKN